MTAQDETHDLVIAAIRHLEKRAQRRVTELSYREKNRDLIRKRKRDQHNANKEQDNERRRRLYVVNRQRHLERHKAWVLANREKENERQRRYREANKEICRMRALQYAKANKEQRKANRRLRRARKANAVTTCAPRVTASATMLRIRIFDNSCAYCGSNEPFHLDHVDPLARGGLHTPSNLAPACQRCNLSKSAKPVEAWYLSQPFFSPERLEFLQAHTGRQWSTAEQLSLLSLL